MICYFCGALATHRVKYQYSDESRITYWLRRPKPICWSCADGFLNRLKARVTET